LSGSPVHFEILPSGPGLLVRELRVAPVAEVQIWAQVGSADERGPAEAGLAHFFEHMLFKGTPRRGVGEVAGEVEGVGGRINAYTSFDVTVYHATLPSAELETGIDVLVDAVRHSLFDPAEIAREIEVVLEEIRRGDDSPPQVLGDALFQEAYRVHPYRHPILGTRESVSAFTHERVVDFHRRWYAPDDLLVVVTGDVETARVREALREAFADATPQGVRRVRPSEPVQTALRTRILTRPFERASLELAWAACDLRHPDAPLLDLLAFVLGEGESSRLVRRVKEHEELAERIDASAYTPLDPGLFFASVELEPERAAAAIEAVVREVERVRVEPVTVAELEKARANFLASEDFERESVSGVARKIGSFQAIAGSFEAEARYLDAIRRATPAELQRVARSWLAPERLTVAAVLPTAAAGALDASGVSAAVGRGLERTARAFSRPAPRAALGDVRSFALPNGASLHVAPRPGVPVVALRAAFLGGLLAEEEATAGLSSFLSSVWLRGTRGHSAADFARAVESLPAEIDGFAGRSSFGLTLETTTRTLDPALDLFAEVLLEPALDPDEIERERRDTLAALARREDRLAEKSFDLFLATLFERHPYRFPVIGTRPAVESFDEAALAAHHARWVRAPNLVLGVAGDVDPEEIAARLSARLADLPGGDFTAPVPPQEPAPTRPRDAELRKAREQAHLVLGFQGLSVRDEDRFALDVISQLLGGQGGRLFLELRDRRGLAYSVGASSVEALAPGFFVLYIGTAPEKLAEAEAGLVAELERLLAAPPAEDELARAKRHLAGSFAIDQQRSAVRAAHLAHDALYGLGPDADRRYAAQILAVSKEDVQRVARRVVRLDARVRALIRP